MNTDFNNRGRTLEVQHEKQTQSLVKWKVRYRNLRRFLESKGVPPEYFEEYNRRLNDEFLYDKEAQV